MSIDVISNFLTIIRNGIMASKNSVSAPYSKIKHEIARILHEEGFIRAYAVEQQDDIRSFIVIELKYVKNESVIHEIKRQSKPSRRVYSSACEIKPIIGGMGLSILSTNKGIMTHKKAKAERVGGELLCTVW